MPSIPSPPVPAHYTSTFKYFLSICVRTLRAEQIKKLKLSQELMCATPGAFIEDSAPQKNAGKQLSTRIFCGTSFYKRQEKKIPKFFLSSCISPSLMTEFRGHNTKLLIICINRSLACSWYA